MGFFQDLFGGRTNESEKAEEGIDKNRELLAALKPPTLDRMDPRYAESYDAGPTAFNEIEANPEYRAAQAEQLAALRNLARNGGRNAATDANLANIQAQENANARGQREAILQNAAASGRGGAGNTLLAQLNSSQNAMNQQSMQDMNVMGQQQNNALNAGMGAANLGANMEQADYGQRANRASAADAITKFNAGQKTGISGMNAGINNDSQRFNSGLGQTEYQNQVQKVTGQAGANNAATQYYQGEGQKNAQRAGNMFSGIVKLGTAAIPKPEAAASRGGRIPGEPVVEGDSFENDFVPLRVSPGEVVVPRTMVGKSPEAIGNFVKNAPEVDVNPDKSARLMALQNIRKRGAH